jgi:glycosyltransferase involved in cell wall biosynthesis
LKLDLERRGFRNVRLWSRGVDADVFKPEGVFERLGLQIERPLFVSVGRVAVEKNIEAFLELDLPGSKVVVGDGPQRAALQARYPQVHFLGQRSGDTLARLYAASDVFVFPSRTDTFGLVILEALACGTPVAAYPVPGPLDVVGDAPVAALNEDLGAACLEALSIRRKACRAFALTRTWRTCAEQFLGNLAY